MSQPDVKPGWAKLADPITSADRKNPLRVIEIAKSRATNPTMVSGLEQAKPHLTSQEKTDLGIS